MKTVVILCVLVLALIGGAAAGKKSLSSKEQVEKCKIWCQDKEKLKEATCKEACPLNQKFNSVWFEALQCSLKCNKKHGIDAPETKACEEGCKKNYEDKVAELDRSCSSACGKEEKEPAAVEKCKKICSPSLIYKAQLENAKAKEDKVEKAAP